MKNKSQHNNSLDWIFDQVKTLSDYGWKCFPVKDKKTLGKWKDLPGCTLDNPLWGSANMIAIVIPDNVVIIDIDDKPGAFQYELYETIYGGVFFQRREGTNSVHCAYRLPDDVYNVRNSANEIPDMPHVDVKAKGGLLFIQQDKKLNLCSPENLPIIPKLLLDLLPKKNSQKTTYTVDHVYPREYSLLCEYLIRQGYEYVRTTERGHLFNHPNSQNRSGATSVAIINGVERVHALSGDPLNNGHSHDLYSAMQILEGLTDQEMMQRRRQIPCFSPVLDSNIDPKSYGETTSVLDRPIKLERPKKWFEQYVMNNIGEYIDTYSKTKLKEKAFNQKHYNDVPLDKDGKHVLPSIYTRGLIKVIDREVYNPKKPDQFTHNGLSYLNTYTKPNCLYCNEYTEAERRIKAHLRFLFNDPEIERNMLNWMAWQVQYPGELVRYAPIVIGKQGDGKSTIINIIKKAMGEENVCNIAMDAITSSFTGWANDGAIGVFEEIRLTGKERFKFYDKIKPYITDPNVSIIRKGKDSFTISNVTNYIAYSNHADAIPISNDDRRWWVLHTQWMEKEFNRNQYNGYFNELYDGFINNDNGSIRGFLLSHSIDSDFIQLKHAPDSIWKQDMRTQSLPSYVRGLEERIEYFASIITCSDDPSFRTKYGI